MEQTRKIKWIKIIAGWTLLGTIVGSVFYILVILSVIEGDLSTLDHINSFVGLILGLTIFYGLWNFKPWGWHITVVAVPLYWLFSIFNALQDYQRGIGVVLSLFIFIDAGILKFLFTPDVRKMFSTEDWSNSNWLIMALWFSGAFLIVYDFFGGLVALIFSVSLFLGLKTAMKYRSHATQSI